MSDSTSEETVNPRYVRQSMFAPLGPEGQRQIEKATVLVCGCGALGSVIANTLARAGVGRLRIVDRDFLEWNNLQRQVLYDEQDVRDRLPKAVVAGRRLEEINSEISIEPIVADVNHTNIATLIDGVDVIADGTDNFETRFLLNDVSHQFGIPWVYGGCIGSEGQVMAIIPGKTGCIRCLMPDTPPPGMTPTCDTAGILGPIVNVVASIQAAEVLKIISGNLAAVNLKLNVIDLWSNRIRQVGLAAMKSGSCPTCGRHEYEWLEGRRGSSVAVLCGRNAVQLSLPERQSVDFDKLGQKLKAVGVVEQNAFLLRATIGDHVLTVFRDGRTVVAGTDDPVQAKGLYAKYIGS